MSRVSVVLHSLLCRRCSRVETLSAHAHGERHRRRWRAFEMMADAAFRWFGPDHCRQSWEWWNDTD